MWKRNLLFLALCFVAVSSFSAQFLRRQRVEPPKAFRPWEAEGEDFRRTVERVDAEFRERWQAEGLTETPPADEWTQVRRLSLGLAGTVPSLEELRALERQPEGQRVAWWLARLFEDRRYADYVAERFARAFVGTNNGPFLVYRRFRFVSWLRDQVEANLRYDELVRQLIQSNGLWTDTPAVNFVTVTLDENDDTPDPIRLTTRTARAFLGMRMDCLQCHDDNLGTMKLGTPEQPRGGVQSDFHKLAAFWSETRTSPLGLKDRPSDYKYKYLHAEEETVVPAEVPFLPGLHQAEGSRRRQLAQWVTHEQNRSFARATVNRVWALLFGRPLVAPIDDIPLLGPFPPGLETLADDFVQHGYDLRRLIRLVVASAPFRRSSQAEEFEITPEHERHGASFPLTRLRPEQMAGALIQSCTLKTIDANIHIVFRLQRFAQENEFVKRYGDTGEDEFEDRGGTVSQRLLVMNGELTRERTNGGDLANAAKRITLLASTPERAIETVYLCVLTRRPTDAERDHFVAKYEAARRTEREPVIEDLYWTLLNSTEFSWNH